MTEIVYLINWKCCNQRPDNNVFFNTYPLCFTLLLSPAHFFCDLVSGFDSAASNAFDVSFEKIIWNWKTWGFFKNNLKLVFKLVFKLMCVGVGVSILFSHYFPLYCLSLSYLWPIYPSFLYQNQSILSLSFLWLSLPSLSSLSYIKMNSTFSIPRSLLSLYHQGSGWLVQGSTPFPPFSALLSPFPHLLSIPPTWNLYFGFHYI